MTTINDTQFQQLTNQIEKLVYDFTNDHDQIDTGCLDIEIELNDLTFYAKIYIGVNTFSEGDGFNEPQLIDTEINSMWIDDQECFGLFDEEVDQCHLTNLQRKQITNQLTK